MNSTTASEPRYHYILWPVVDKHSYLLFVCLFICFHSLLQPLETMLVAKALRHSDCLCCDQGDQRCVLKGRIKSTGDEMNV